MKVLDLFAGIGGFALGLESTGFFETVKFVEKDKYCQKVLRKNFPNIPIDEDIKNLKGKEGEADVIVGGFPCQPMSVAGKRKGTDDDRYLWPEMFRLIREIKPQFVIGENVQGIINIQNGMVLRQVQDDLESEGFEVQCFVIPASGIGAWHQRKRVWIVAANTSSSKNVSNTISSLRGGGRAIGQSGENKVWRFYSEEEEQTRLDIRSETIGRNAVSGEEEVILQSNNERQQESNTSKESEGQTLSSGGHVADETKQKLIKPNKQLKNTNLLKIKENKITAKIRMFFVHCFGLPAIKTFLRNILKYNI